MKFYETTYDEYLTALYKKNLHPELEPVLKNVSKDLTKMPNMIFYGPSGVGKYTQVLNLIRNYSPSGLTLPQGKRMNIQTEKYEYCYHISDIHYEIDMALLGCNSKLIWHDVIQQIVDIVAVKPDAHKTAIIVCKNFHMIHTELLDIFYSYIQEYNSKFSVVHFKFILITEHLSFIPNNILMSSTVINVCRPIIPIGSEQSSVQNPLLFKSGSRLRINPSCHVSANNILNLKEYHHLNKLENADQIPNDIFNIICNEILTQMLNIKPSSALSNKATQFRDAIYDIFVYNLDPIECIWFVTSCLIENGSLAGEAISDVMVRSYDCFKYFNNNYRPIYHLEAFFYYTLLKIHGINELDKSV